LILMQHCTIKTIRFILARYTICCRL
jgi:hypothetical protein